MRMLEKGIEELKLYSDSHEAWNIYMPAIRHDSPDPDLETIHIACSSPR